MLTLGDDVPIGAAIATFDPVSAKYGNHTDGRSHAAIYMGPAANGIRVIDQWVGRPCNYRIIRNKGGQGLPVDDASRYHLIELEG